MVTRSVARLTLALLLCGPATTAFATGQYIPEMRFFSHSGVDPENSLAYFHGRLGILRPTFDDNRLFAAYRQMMGGSFTDAQARELLAPCCDAPGADDNTTGSWNDVRKRVLGPAAPAKDPPPRQRSPDQSAFDVTCFPNAYRNAAATLTIRINQHGATDPSVREWTIGEDAVLANCATDSALPADVRNAPDWLKADRAYQIATAYFIAHMRARPTPRRDRAGCRLAVRKLARYLAARAGVHGAICAKTTASIAAASSAIAGLAADPELAEYRADAPKLASMLAFGTRPQERAQELAGSLLAADLPATLAVDIHDLRDLERTGKRYTDVGAFIYDIDMLTGEKGRQNADVKADVLKRWHDGHALPWLAAAMMFLDPGDPDTAEAIAASQAIDANSPAYYTFAWNRLRLLIGLGKADDARAELDRQLAAPALPEGVGNLLRYQRLTLARNIGEFVKFAVRRGEFLMYVYDPRTNLAAVPLPLAPTKWDRDTATMVSWRAELTQKEPLFFDADGAYAMSLYMPLPMMAQVVLAPPCPPTSSATSDLRCGREPCCSTTPIPPSRWRRPWRRSFRNTPTTGRAIAPPPPPRPGRSRPRSSCSSCRPARPYPDFGLGYVYKRDKIGLFGPRWWAAGDSPSRTATPPAPRCSAPIARCHCRSWRHRSSP